MNGFGGVDDGLFMVGVREPRRSRRRTGANGRRRAVTTPSLADAFLDAGTVAVVQTFWKVRDDDALRVMRHFVPLWAGEDMSPIAALTRARHAVMEGSAGIQHPFVWAVFTV
jgi:CHAT domain-containing protein